MPLYDFSCDKCGEDFEGFCRIAEIEKQVCVKCGRPGLKRNITTKSKPICLEYYSESLNLHVTGPAQRDKYMKEKGFAAAGTL